MDSNTCLKEIAAPCGADAENEAPNLVAGRLTLIPASLPIGAHSRSSGTPSSYGISRLGIVPESEFAEVEIDTTKERRKSTFKLSIGLLEKLKNYAATVGRYQYAIVTQALEEFPGFESEDFDQDQAASPETVDYQHRLEKDMAATREALERTRAKLRSAESQLVVAHDLEATSNEKAKLDASGFLGLLLAALWHRR